MMVPGVPETGHYETGQERMQVPFWDDQDAYLRNSPVLSIPRMKTPLLMAFGDKDGAVDWHQGIEMYNLARRAGKQFVLLTAEPGAGKSAFIAQLAHDYPEWLVGLCVEEMVPESRLLLAEDLLFLALIHPAHALIELA